MRTFLAVIAAVGSIAFASASAHACNARGQYCGYPDWASNAFSGPYAQTPKGAIKLEHEHYHAKRHYKPKAVYVPKYVVKKVYVKKYVYGH
ncbi:MAG: hypothetical protein R3D67_05760 [Hyphomicrobiaceae bacterium]